MQNESMHPTNPFQHFSSTTVFCAAAATLVPVLITLCFAARDATEPVDDTPVDAALPDVRCVDCEDVIVVRVDVVGAVGVCVAARPRADIDVVDVVVAPGADVPPRPARALVRGAAASAPNPVIKNANINRIFLI